MSFTLSHALHRAGRIKQIIDREARSRQSSTVRIMRLNAMLLKVQRRLAQLVMSGQHSLQPIAVSGHRQAVR